MKEDKYVDIIITDITLDNTDLRNPKTTARYIEKGVRSKKHFRAHKKVAVNTLKETRKGEFEIDLGEIPEEIDGKKVRILYPKAGIPVFPSKNMTDFINSKKRNLRQKNNV